MGQNGMKLNLINGQWVAGENSSTNVNPANTLDIIGEYTHADLEQVHTAIEAADGAAASWANASPQVRSDLLEHIAQAIITQSVDLGQLLAREEGK